MVIKIVEQSPHYNWREETEYYELATTNYSYATYFGVTLDETLHGCYHDLGAAMNEAIKLQSLVGLCGILSNIEVIKLAKK